MNSHILVVVDEAVSRETLCDRLEIRGYTADSASNFHEALVAIERCMPDAVLLDTQLSGGHGLLFAAWLRLERAGQHIPVIAITAQSTRNERERILQAGCHACISKPVDFPALLERLDGWLTVAAVMNGAPVATHTRSSRASARLSAALQLGI